MLTNKTNTVLYIGVTNNLERRYFEHLLKVNKSFTKKYNLNKLIYFEEYNSVDDAIAREKQLKNWHREWKEKLVKRMNPNFNDLLDAEINSA
jgi:putative endonuclease